MNYIANHLPLRCATSPEWLPVVLADFNVFLADHAECERKAAMSALSFIARFADRPALVEPMIALAREELAHFHEVCKLLARRGVPLAVNQKNPYVERLRTHVRHPLDEFYLDRLIVSALIEARSCERFAILSAGLPADHELTGFYARLAREEAGHYRVFLRQAQHAYEEELVQRRLDEMLDREADIIRSLPPRPAMH